MPTNAEPRRHALANLSRPLCVIDTEWTHASVADARLISVAIARLLPGGETVLREWVINPGVPIDPATTAVHGMTDADVKDLPPFAAVAFEIADFLEDADIGGYSVASDIQILERELDAAEHPLRTAELRIVDPLRLWQKREPRKLTDAYERFVGPIPESLRAHDALDDVRMTLAVIERMAGDRSAGEMHAEAHPRMVDPAGKFVRDDQDRIAFAFGKHRGDPSTATRTFSTGCSARTSRRRRLRSPGPSSTGSGRPPPRRTPATARPKAPRQSTATSRSDRAAGP